MQQIKLGEVRISSLIERDGPVRTALAMFPDATPERVARALSKLPGFTYDAKTEMLVITYQTFILRTPTCTVLIDTCVGEHPGYHESLNYDKTPWMRALEAHNLTVEDIDYVFCTHLHIDHVGWNTRLIDGRHVPTFPNAKYVFSRREYEHWKTHESGAVGPSFAACVTPIVEAGQALLVDDSFVLNDQLSLVPAAGHSPGHVCVSLKSQGQHALFCGDMMHNAIQCIEPGWSTKLCSDPAGAAATRRRFFAQYCESDTLFIPTHFPAPTAGHVRADGDAYRFDFLPSL
jgi:glyoxylase-like metal-dependent hydrolase (beta-lactamase superfamily II)